MRLDDSKVAALIKEGLSAPEIAKRLGASRQGIHLWAIRNGVPLDSRPPGRPRTDEGRIVCLKLKVPLAVKRWANQNLDRVQSLVVNAYKNPAAGDIWEDIYSDPTACTLCEGYAKVEDSEGRDIRCHKCAGSGLANPLTGGYHPKAI